MVKPLLMLAILFAGYAIGITQARPLHYQQYRATFTPAGCTWAEANGIKIKQDERSCTGVLRFDPRTFGDGGSVLLDDDRFVQVTSASMLSFERLEHDHLEDTPQQKAASRLILVIFMVVMVLLGLTLAIPDKKRKAKQVSDTCNGSE